MVEKSERPPEDAANMVGTASVEQDKTGTARSERQVSTDKDLNENLESGENQRPATKNMPGIESPTLTLSSLLHTSAPSMDDRLGRYRIEKLLGQGGFGEVYQAFDEELGRFVAVKVFRNRFSDQKNRSDFVAEARAVAKLDHPHIVPVYDVGYTEAGDGYIVSKLIEGSDLANKLLADRLSFKQAAHWCFMIAAALDHAHQRGLIHRDVKPANILVDEKGRVFLTDFGISVQDNTEMTAKLSGTPAYMSPEQARGESHRVDRRSDLYSLGVVLFEMIAGQRPFTSKDRLDLMIRISQESAPSLASIRSDVPPELERICSKALAIRATDRFASAKEMALELRSFLQQGRSVGKSINRDAIISAGISPKGLRSFDDMDADVFWELVPGSRSTDGVPDLIRRWLVKLEGRSTTKLPIGLIYGPSGCGKSSFVKAGILPNLPANILPVYLEASARDTESRLCRAVCRAAGISVSEGKDLRQLLLELRQGKHLKPGQKVLLVLDQFEQWLHATPVYRGSELVEALRHLDGDRVTGLLLIRDDFWMSTSRFLRELEIEITSGNSEMLDLFEPEHACKVLGLFGRALGKLPAEENQWTPDQLQFLSLAVDGLATDQKVISVRLALFAEMFRSRPWTVGDLRSVGGSLGVGKTFLNETFDSAAAPAENRQFRDSVKAILRSLMPETGTEIKGHSQPRSTLASVCGLPSESDHFQRVLTLIDQELRLITPVDAQQLEIRNSNSFLSASKSEAAAVASREPGLEQVDRGDQPEPHYQLAHDYLVPALREWLFDDLQRTRRGRVEMMLADRASLWSLKRDPRQLPTVFEYLTIISLVPIHRRTPIQQEMLRFCRQRVLLWVVLLGVLEIAIAILLDTFFFESRVLKWLTWLTLETGQALHETLTYRTFWLFVAVGVGLRFGQKQLSRKANYLKLQASLTPWRICTLLGIAIAYLLVRRLLVEPWLSDQDTGMFEAWLTILIQRFAWICCGFLGANLVVTAAPRCVEFAKKRLAWLVPQPMIDGLRAAKSAWYRSWRYLEHLRITRRDARVRRANNLLETKAEAWKTHPTNKNLPSLRQWLQIRRNSSPRLWLEPQRQMMQRAAKFHTIVLASGLALVLLLGNIVYHLPSPEERNRFLRRSELSINLTLARFGWADIGCLMADIDDFDTSQQHTLVDVLSSDRQQALQALKQAAANCSSEALWRRKAKYAIVALALGDTEIAADMCQYADRPDPGQRTIFINEFPQWEWYLPERKTNLQQLAEMVAESRDSGWRSGLSLAVGSIPVDQLRELNPSGLDAWNQLASRWFKEHRDTSTHSAASWLLRRWKLPLPKVPDQHKILPERDWFVNSAGMTMLRIALPESETKLSEYWIASCEVTRGQFESFMQDADYTFEKPTDWEGVDTNVSPTSDHPAQRVSWYDAVMFCNWLSRQEGKTPAYRKTGKQEKGDHDDELYDQWELVAGASGYRLPEEVEWEYATRAGSQTAWSSGSDEQLLADYCQMFPSELTAVVGHKLPNAWGLQDVHGNVREWCNDLHRSYGEGSYRVSRSGSWDFAAAYCESLNRGWYYPSSHIVNYGFRVALSSPGIPQSAEPQ